MTVATGIYSVDYVNKVWQLLLPPTKRLPKWLAWGAALMAGKQWKHDAFLGSYALGSNDPAYNASSGGYVTGNRIIYYINGSGTYYGDNAVYEAITAVPTNTPPTGTNVVPSVPPASVVDIPTALNWLATGNNGSPFYWVQVQPNFIGVNERTLWSCQQLTMEIALNKWFNVSPYANYQWDHTGAPPYTQIYIETGLVITKEMGAFPLPKGYGDFPLPVYDTFGYFPVPPAASQYNFTIYVPNAIFNYLVTGSAYSPGHTEDITNATKNGSMIRSLIDKMNQVGMLYNITTY